MLSAIKNQIAHGWAIPIANPRPDRGDLTATKRVLIVDDNFDQHGILRVLLGHHGFATIHAATLADARAVLESGPVDLVILDVRLGRDHGLDLLYSLPFEGPDVPVLVCTSDADARFRYPAAANAAAGWMVKPFNFDELICCVQRITGSESP
jgi:DNA-binding response OmpR family regulator